MNLLSKLVVVALLSSFLMVPYVLAAEKEVSPSIGRTAPTKQRKPTLWQKEAETEYGFPSKLWNDAVYREEEYWDEYRTMCFRNAERYYQEGYRAQHYGDYANAISFYESAMRTAPSDATEIRASYQFALGTAYDNLGNLEQAIYCYQEAIAMTKIPHKDWPSALKNARKRMVAPLLHEAYRKQTSKDKKGNYDFDSAIRLYEGALKIDDDPLTHLNLGTAYQAINNTSKAIEQYKKALPEGLVLDLSPNPKAKYLKKMATGNFDSSQLDAVYYLGTVYDGMNQRNLALECYKRFLAEAPANNANVKACTERLQQLGVR